MNFLPQDDKLIGFKGIPAQPISLIFLIIPYFFLWSLAAHKTWKFN